MRRTRATPAGCSVDLERGEVLVERAKDKSDPRRLFVGACLRPIVERLVLRVEADHRAGRNADRAFLPHCRALLVNIAAGWYRREQLRATVAKGKPDPREFRAWRELP